MSSVNELIAKLDANVSQFNNTVSNIENYAKDAKEKTDKFNYLLKDQA